MSYRRVLPRDLFNEAKLLKCLGRLCLMIHEGQLRLNFNFEDEDISLNNVGFVVMQNESDGSLYVDNLEFYTEKFVYFQFASEYNSKENWPLRFGSENGAAGCVFEDNGDFTQEFLDAIGDK